MRGGGETIQVPISVLLVPGALALLGVLLLVAAWLEDRALSPRRLILLAARTRNTPEHAERLVAAEYERLLSSYQRR